MWNVSKKQLFLPGGVMQFLKTVLVLVVSIAVLALSGCGGGSDKSTTTKDPFATQDNNATSGDSGNIMFTDKAGLAQGGQSNMLEPWEIKDVDPSIVPSVAVLQMLPFKVTDSNGNPRVGVPITLSVYSITSLDPNDVTVDFLVSPVTEPNQRTITTDSAGMGIFNVSVSLKTPPLGSFTSSSVVFKATTNDPIPVTAYVGGSYSMTAKLPPASS